MIVRISTEGQYRLSSTLLDEVNDLDNDLVNRIADCEESEFKERFATILALVRDRGEKVPDDEILESHVVLPHPDITLEEARRFFTGDGLFPDDDEM